MYGIISYGFYVPRYRITIDEIAKVWKKNPKHITQSLLVKEKSVAGIDEDALTMAYEACSMALKKSGLSTNDIGAVFFGSESPPYAVNPASTILAQFLHIEKHYLATDMQFACKAATGGVIAGCGLLASGFAQHVLVVGSDKATGRPHDALEYTAGSGSVALVLGKKNSAVNIIDSLSYSSDTPDFWRREGIRYPSHGGRFTGKPSYFHHVKEVSKQMLTKHNMKPSDFKYAVFHMPNGKYPQTIGAMLGFSSEQISPSLVVTHLGNSYTASALMGLVSVLEQAKPGERIFFASYGSGAGSDAFIFETTRYLPKVRQSFRRVVQSKTYIPYVDYLKAMDSI